MSKDVGAHSPVVVEPLLEDLDGLLGEVSAALAAGRTAALVSRAPVGVLFRGGVFVRRGAGVALPLANCREKEDRYSAPRMLQNL